MRVSAEPGLRRILGYGWLAAGGAVVLSTVGFVISGYSPVPYWDQWFEIAWLERYYAGEVGLGTLARSVGIHLPFVPRLFTFADMHYFGGANLLLIPTILLMQSGSCALYCREALRAPDLSAGVRRFLIGGYLMLLLTAAQIENLLWGFQVAFVLAYAAPLVALVALSAALAPAATHAGRWAWFSLSLAAAAVATFTEGNGVLTWPLLLGMACLFPCGWRARGMLLAAAVLVLLAWRTRIVLWFPEMDGEASVGLVFDFLLRQLGLPFHTSAWAARVFGAVGLVAAVAVTVAAARRWRQVTRFQYLHLAMLGYALASAIVTAQTRAPVLRSWGLGIRYTTTAVFFWASLLTLLVIHARRLERGAGRAQAVLASATVLACGLFLWPAHLRAGGTARPQRLAREQGGLALIVGVHDLDAYRHFTLFTGPIPRLASFLRVHRLSVFRPDWPHWLGDPVAAHATIADGGDLAGALEHVDAVETPAPAQATQVGYRVTGWAWDQTRDRPSPLVVLVDEADRICGFATPTVDRPDRAADTGRRRLRRSGWLGFARLPPGTGIRAYALTADRAHAELIGMWPPPEITGAPEGG